MLRNSTRFYSTASRYRSFPPFPKKITLRGKIKCAKVWNHNSYVSLIREYASRKNIFTDKQHSNKISLYAEYCNENLHHRVFRS